MSLKIGEINRMIVLRKTDIGYMLKEDEQEVFLHFNESDHQPLEPDMVVDAFLYYDQKGRLAATLKKPYLTTSKGALLKVKDVLPSLGVFLDMGISKDLLLSKEDLPLNKKFWPEPMDMVYVQLKVKGKFVAKIPAKDELGFTPSEPLQRMSKVSAYVHKIIKDGLLLITEDGHFIFVHDSQIQDVYRIGQKVNVKVTYESEKGYSGSLKVQKEVQLFEDANLILSYLARHDVLPLTAQSSAEEVSKFFVMSKKAFKRAIGHLYKERKIDFINNQTVLLKK